MKPPKYTVIKIPKDDKLLQQFDEIRKRDGFITFTSAIRAAMRLVVALGDFNPQPKDDKRLVQI